MAKLNRLTAKIFGETASTTNTPKEIGQFGSAKAGTYNATGDVATIQNLPAWSNGWIDAVTPTNQFPPLPEMTGVHKVLSYQNAYLLQQGIPEWDSATTYYTNGFCSKAGKIYISQTDNNLNNDPASDTVNWKVFESGGARNIGEIVASTIPLTDAGLHLLDGALLQYGSYQAFIDYIADLYDSGNYDDIFETEANWQSAVTTYGVCGKFVYDSVNNTVRLPKITGFIEGTTDLTALGDLIQAGLPNITGSGESHNGSLRFMAGAFSTLSTGRSVPANTGGAFTEKFDFDASRSSSIYGNSTTVQPQAIKVLYYIVIATTTKTDIQVDIDEIATDLNGKADVDLSNTTPTISFATAMNTAGIRTVIETYVNGTSWYRVYSDGWCEQGGYSAGSSVRTVNLLKAYNNTNYSVFLQGKNTDYWSVVNNVDSITGSQFTIYAYDNDRHCFWKACGYIN